MQRRRTKKFQFSVAPSKPKDNTTYMSIFPLKKSQIYLNEKLNESHKVNFQDEEIVDHFRQLIKEEKVQKIQKHEVDKYFSSVVTRPAANIGSPVATTFLDSLNLNSQDLVQVCENKDFSLKSYYNYLHDQEIEKNYNKIQQRNQNLETLLHQQKQKQTKLQQEMSNFHEISKIGRSKQEQQVLDPVHIKFQQKVTSFNPKERQRLQISRINNLRDSKNKWF